MASSTEKKSARQSTLAFRLINPELFIKPNKVIMIGGSVALAGCVLFLGYMNFGEEKQTVSTSVHNHGRVKSKWD
ncbi:hypothetical protein pdam_00004996 [Pocillopora damicornis]|uniref:Small integral membrane protein 8 n=1 Tax=Pocillopora damicornis TaxID=46731 RepID=A0A3M6UVK4_POCDA|nr:hypothetical protein pdam_00004996 [Pocillopora damicornis]